MEIHGSLPWDASERLGAEWPTFDYTGQDSHTDYHLGTDCQITDNVMVYHSYLTAYIAGLVDNVTHEFFDPQENKTYEVGVKSTLLDGTLRLNDAFYTGTHEGLS